MTRADLKQLRALHFEIRTLSIKMLKPKPSQVVDHYKDYRHNPKGVVKSLAGYDDGQMEYNRLEKRMAKIKRRQLKLVEQMETWLESVPDPEMRAILRLYYRDGLSQEDIAKQMGYDQSVISRRIKEFWKLA